MRGAKQYFYFDCTWDEVLVLCFAAKVSEVKRGIKRDDPLIVDK